MTRPRSQIPFNVPTFEQSFGATTTFDFNNGPVQHVVLRGPVTFAFANIQDGMIYVLHIQQDGTGGRVATWPSNAKFGLASSVLSVGANVIDMFLGFARGVDLHIVAVKGFL